MRVCADDAGVTVHGSFVAPNEHTFYFLVESDDLIEVSEFFGPPVLQDHDADILPIMTLREVDEMLQD